MEPSSSPASNRIESFAQARDIAAYWSFQSITMRDGIALHYARYIAAQPVRGSVLVLTDRDEFIEKYSEVAENFAGRGWQVWCLEWRGRRRIHASSDEEDESETPHSRATVEGDGPDEKAVAPVADIRGDTPDWFTSSLNDLEIFWHQVWRPATGGVATIVLAHGLGAHLALRWQIKAGARKLGKTVFVLTAPMVQPKCSGLPLWGAYLVSQLIGIFTLAAPYPGQRHAQRLNRTFRTNRLTRDKARFGILRKWLEQYPELAPRRHGWGWLAEAFQSALRLHRDLLTGGAPAFGFRFRFMLELWRRCRQCGWRPSRCLRAYRDLRDRTKLPLPTLVMLTPSDDMVDGNAQYALAGRLLHGRIVEFVDAKHDLMQEEERVRRRVWREIDSFLARYFPDGGKTRTS